MYLWYSTGYLMYTVLHMTRFKREGKAELFFSFKVLSRRVNSGAQNAHL